MRSEPLSSSKYPLTILQWMAPSLVRDELLRNEGWVPGHCERALKIFPNQGMHVVATLIAALHRNAIDYLEQAPVLALAAGGGSTARRRQERSFIAQKCGPLFERGVRLRDMLAAHELPLPMRKIVGLSVRPGLWQPILLLAQIVPSSTLAQIIPDDPARQARWLGRLGQWRAHLVARHRFAPALFEWAAIALAHDDHVEGLTEVADYLSDPSRPFNARWTWAKAAAESDLWHDQIAQMTLTAKHGASVDHEANYAPFPDEAKVDGFTFVALRSGRSLILEGQRMRHCVASYLSDVLKGFSRIYSIRLDGRRIATVQYSGGQVRQIKGSCNRSVGVKIERAAAKFLKQVDA